MFKDISLAKFKDYLMDSQAISCTIPTTYSIQFLKISVGEILIFFILTLIYKNEIITAKIKYKNQTIHNMATAFKYRSGSQRDLDSIVNNQLFFAQKDSLNDPFEAAFDSSWQELMAKEIREADVDGIIAYGHKFGHPSNQGKGWDDFMELPPIGKKMPSHHLQGTIMHLKSDIHHYFDRHGIFSLSKDVTNELIWAHYAGQHCGFAIEYDLDVIFDKKQNRNIKLSNVIEVKYQNEPVQLFDSDVIEYLHGDSGKIVRKLCQNFIGIKSRAWEYEKEIRLVSSKIGLIEIPKKSVRTITFGLRCSDQNVEKVILALEGRDISYQKIVMQQSSYLLKPEPIKVSR